MNSKYAYAQKAELPVAGRLLSEVVAEAAPELAVSEHLVVLLNGLEVSEKMGEIRVTENDRIVIGSLPAGGGKKGKGIGMIIVGIVITVLSYGSASQLGAACFAMGMGMVLGGLSTLLIKPPTLGETPTSSSMSLGTTNTVGGQSNQSKPYQCVPKIYGRHRMFPNLAATSLVENIGVSSKISAIYDLGLGNVQYDLDTVRIGETSAATFGAEFHSHIDTTDIRPQFVTANIHYDQMQFLIKKDEPMVVTTADGASAVDINLSFPSGLFHMDDAGNTGLDLVEFIIEWAPAGSGSWTPVGPETISGAKAFDGKTIYFNYDQTRWREPSISSVTRRGIVIEDGIKKPFVANVHIDFPAKGRFDVRFTRTTPVWNGDRMMSREDGFTSYNTCNLTLVKSYLQGQMFALRHRHTMLEMRLTASDKLNGVVQNMSVVATSVLPYYDNSGRKLGEQATRNPAWCALDVMLGDANPRPLTKAQIDWPSWVRFAQVCDQDRTWHMTDESGQVTTVTDKRYYLDTVIESVSTVREVLDSMLSGCRANLVITSTGKYAVALDEEKSIPRQLITPENSWNFSGNRTFADPLHALRVTFTDATRDYNKLEIMVYADGYGAVEDKANNIQAATNIQTLSTMGITDAAHAWAFGRYMLAQTVFRAETFSVTMDIEHMVFQRGDLVYVAHDVPQIGGTPTRVSFVGRDAQNHRTNTIYVANAPETPPTNYTVRFSDGSIHQGRVVQVEPDGGITLADATGIDADDLIVLGHNDRITRPYLIQSVSPGDDMSANITLAVYEPKMYQADISAMPVWNAGMTDPDGFGANLEIAKLTATGKVVYENRMPSAQITLTWDVGGDSYGGADVYMLDGVGTLRSLGSVVGRSFMTILDYTNDQSVRGKMMFRVVPKTTSGIQGKQAEVAHVTEDDHTPPKAPYNIAFGTNTGGADVLTWVPPGDLDISTYEIRTTTDVTSRDWDAATVFHTVDYPATSVLIQDKTLGYLVRAVDTSGNIGVLGFLGNGAPVPEYVVDGYVVTDYVDGTTGVEVSADEYFDFNTLLDHLDK